MVVAFEIFEHLFPDQTNGFLKGIANVLSDDGVLLLSTPNHDVVLKSGVEVPAFHINNYGAGRLKQTLRQFFPRVKLYGQLRNRGFAQDLVFALDFFNFRHHAFIRSLRNNQKITQSADRQTSLNEPSIWNSSLGWGDSTKFKFSPMLWRQSGTTLAVCSLK